LSTDDKVQLAELAHELFELRRVNSLLKSAALYGTQVIPRVRETPGVIATLGENRLRCRVSVRRASTQRGVRLLSTPRDESHHHSIG
jgi:hypothetical protein